MISQFGFGFISTRIDGISFTPSFISNFFRSSLARPGVYWVQAMGGGGGGGGKNEIATQTGQAGSSGAFVTQYVYIQYEGTSFIEGSPGLGGAPGQNFEAGRSGGSGGTTSIRTLNSSILTTSGGAGGLGAGYGVGSPSYNPTPTGNGGIGGGGWGSSGGQSGGTGQLTLTRVA